MSAETECENWDWRSSYVISALGHIPYGLSNSCRDPVGTHQVSFKCHMQMTVIGLVLY